jgi:hypothetical protein
LVFADKPAETVYFRREREREREKERERERGALQDWYVTDSKGSNTVSTDSQLSIPVRLDCTGVQSLVLEENASRCSEYVVNTKNSNYEQYQPMKEHRLTKICCFKMYRMPRKSETIVTVGVLTELS